jgi:hypothetical protein
MFAHSVPVHTRFNLYLLRLMMYPDTLAASSCLALHGAPFEAQPPAFRSFVTQSNYGDSIVGMSTFDDSDGLNLFRYHNFGTKTDTEFKALR